MLRSGPQVFIHLLWTVVSVSVKFSKTLRSYKNIPQDTHRCDSVLKAFSMLFWVSVIHAQLGDVSRTSYTALLNGSSSPFPLLFSCTL